MMGTIRKSALLTAFLLGLPTAFAKPITVTLSLNGKVTMAELARNVQDPTSDHYNRFYEPSEIRELAGPADQDYRELLNGLTAEGMTVVQESPTHLWVTVRGEQSIYESLFGTKVQHFSNGTHRAMSQVQVPYHLSLVKSVTGLDNTHKLYPKYIKMDRPASAGGVSQNDIKAAYGFTSLYSAGLNGQGQHIAIATYGGFRVANVRKFFSLSAISPAPNVDQVAFNGTAQYEEGAAGETELDAEMAGMIAPGSNIHVFGSAENSDAGELAMFTAILDDNRAKIVNYSWGNCETYTDATHKTAMQAVFQRALAQGVNIFVASGDSGSDSCGDGTNKADWPGASPYVVTVGGTSMNYSNGSLSETGWDGSGGGISELWDLPSWEQGLGSVYVKRAYPDVAFNADPYTGQAIYTGSQPSWAVVGGTSMAAPQWAGFMALVNQARSKDGKAGLGFMTPMLYAMPAATRAQAFHDVTSGRNGLYTSAAGWDAVTGWGSPKADTLLGYLRTL